MKKYLVTLEFRYTDVPKGADDYKCVRRVLTLGIHDDFEEACDTGNLTLEFLESKFKLNPNYNRKERLSATGGCFGGKNTLITNLGYLITPFEFYMKITTLTLGPADEVVKDVLEGVERYKAYKKGESDE